MTLTNLYSGAVANHYSSYRPPLHQNILNHVLSDQDFFPIGADIGCGTGYSTIALADYCGQVYGIDASQSMLKRATKHQKITYLNGTGGNMPLPDRSVDVVTFAGSLFYMKENATFEELKRICRKNAIVIPYDFEILLADALQSQGINLQDNSPNYDPAVNLSGVSGFKELAAGSEQIELNVVFTEFAHILLADHQRYEAFSKKYHLADPFPALENDLASRGKQFVLRADLYYSKYGINGQGY